MQVKIATSLLILSTRAPLAASTVLKNIDCSSENHRHNNSMIHFKSPLLADPQDQKGSESSQSSVLIILNYSLSCPPSPVFDKLWSKATCRICADGGANRLYDATTAGSMPSTTKDRREDYIPDRIRGDLDSLRPDVREFYASKGVVIEKDPCQETNDLDKALQACCETSNNKEKKSLFDSVVVFGAFGGRFDQEMASIQALFTWSDVFRHQLFLYTDETFAFLVPAQTDCQIELPYFDSTEPSSKDKDNSDDIQPFGEGPTCGLIPIGRRVESCTTTGLKWDLDGNMPMEFGGLVSSSNRVMKPVATIRSSEPVVFTAEVQIMKK